MRVTLKMFLMLLLLGSSLGIQAQTDQPNILFIIADDMGWSQTSSREITLDNPSDFYETPIIASLAQEGIAFPNAYVNGANCAPTRAAILSGQWASRPTNNVFAVDRLNRGGQNSLLVGPEQGISNGQDEIPASAITVAETMKTAGYTTAHFGKYHSGGSMDNAPEEQGFDFNYGGGSAGNPGNYFASDNSGNWRFSNSIGTELDPYAQPYTAEQSQALAGDNSLEGTAKHVTDAMAEAAIDFMEQHKDTPFFMHYSNYAIHGPWGERNARPDLYAKYNDKFNTNPSQIGHDNVAQAAILEGMDQTTGRLVDYLKNTDDPRNPGKKLAETTLVYFVSDNGGANGPEDNIPLKGMKGEYTEGGIRSVSFAWSDGLLANMGTVNMTPIQAFDIYPTFAEMGGASLPQDYPVDGVTLWSMLNGNNPELERDALFWHFPGTLTDNKRDQRPVTVIRKSDYKLTYFYETASYQMYNLATDKEEQVDLLAGAPAEEIRTIANDLSKDLIQYLIDVEAPLPTYRSTGELVPLPEEYPLDGIIDPVVQSCVLNTYQALWNFDTLAETNDVSKNNYDPTGLTGNITYDDTDFKEGDQAIVFDGATKIQYSQESGTFMVEETNAITVAMWIKPDDLEGLQQLFEEGGGTTGIAMRLNGTNLESNVRDTRNRVDILEAAYPTDGDWHHVALMYDGTNNVHKLYIDGIVVASSTDAPGNVREHNGEGGIAGVFKRDCFGETNDNFYQGKMDAVAVYNLALSVEEIGATTCSTIVLPRPDVTSCVLDTYQALWNYDDGVATRDISSNENDALGITGRVTYDATDFIEGNRSAIFDGATKIRYSGDSGSFMIDETSARTVAMWIKPDDLEGLQQLYEEGGGITGIAMRLNGARIETNVRDNRNRVDTLSAAYPTDGDWHHVALVYDGANTSQKIFVDGNVVATSTAAPVEVRQHNGDGGIAGVQGKDSFGEELDLFYQGKMDAVAVYGIVLSDDQVSQAACITEVPPRPVVESCVLDTYQALWNFDKDAETRDVSPNFNDAIAIAGTVVYDSLDVKEGDQSARFDGFTKIQYSQETGTFLTDSTQARTVAMWIKPDALVGIQELFEEGGGERGMAFRLNDSLLETNIRNSKEVVDTLSVAYPVDGDWHHVAMVYDGVNTSQTIYIDGKVVGATTTAPVIISQHFGAGGIAGIQKRDSFGEKDDHFYIGKMDAVAVYNLALTAEEIELAACGFPDEPTPCTEFTVDTEDFERGYGDWIDGGSNATRIRVYRSSSTTGFSYGYYVRIKDDSSSSMITTQTIDASEFETMTVDLSYFCQGMDTSEEGFVLELSTDDGNSFEIVKEWNLNDEFVNNKDYDDTVDLEGPFSKTTRLRIRSTGSSYYDAVYIDQIVISACTQGDIGDTKDPIVDAPADNVVKVSVSPNPFIDTLHFDITGDYQTANVVLYNLMGQKVLTKEYQAGEDMTVTGLQLPKGHYFAKIVVGNKFFLRLLVKKY